MEKDKSIYAPMSGVGGIVYDKDAVYIELGRYQGSIFLQNLISFSPKKFGLISLHLPSVNVCCRNKMPCFSLFPSFLSFSLSFSFLYFLLFILFPPFLPFFSS